jgi:hypothetical protein
MTHFLAAILKRVNFTSWAFIVYIATMQNAVIVRNGKRVFINSSVSSSSHERRKKYLCLVWRIRRQLREKNEAYLLIL